MPSLLLINEPPLQVLPTLAKAIGLNEAIVLQQVHYWLNPRFNKNFFAGHYWVRNTYEQWKQQFPFLSGRTLRRTIGRLEALGLLVSCMGGHLKQIKFYTVNYDLLNQIDLASPNRVLRASPQKRPEGEETCQTDLASPNRVLQARPQKRPEGGRTCQSIQGSLENGEIDSSAQNVPIWPNWPDGETGGFAENSLETMINQEANPIRSNWPPHLAGLAASSGQIGHSLWSGCPPHLAKLATSSGQFGQLSYSKNTFREYTENTLPLPPLPRISFQKEEEEKKNKFGLEFKNPVPGEEDQQLTDEAQGLEARRCELEPVKQQLTVGGQRLETGSCELDNQQPMGKDQALEAGGCELEPGNQQLAVEVQGLGARGCKLGNQQPAGEDQQSEAGDREANQQPTVAETSPAPVTNSGNHQACDPMVLAMIGVWNEVVQAKLNPGQNAYLTPKRQSLLEQFLNTVLADKAGQEKLDAWRDYCTRIANTRFLAGENSSGFKVSLDWALIPEKAYKVLEGMIYDKPQPKPVDTQPQSWEELAAEIRQNSQQGQGERYTEEWLTICQNLAKVLGQTMFKSWFAKVSLAILKENIAILQVDTLFKRDYIDSHFRFDIVRAIQTHHPTVTQLKIEVIPRSDGHACLRNGKTTTQPK